MSIEDLHKINTNQEAAWYATTEAREAEKVSRLWDHPTLADTEIPEAAKIPPSLWAECKRVGDTPPLFLIGRRLFCRTEDLRKWLDAKARAGAPGSKPLRARAQREAT